MLTLYIIWPDKTREKWIQDGIKKYSEILQRYCRCHLIEVKIPEYVKKRNTLEKIKIEGNLLHAHIKTGYVICLDEKGKMMSSLEFSKFLGDLECGSTKNINFVIGGDMGLSDELKSKANLILSLSQLTFTHELTRVILLEQLYRAFTILKGEPYHH